MGRVGSGRAVMVALGIAALVVVPGVGPVLAQEPSASPGPVAGAGGLTLGADQALLTDDFATIVDWGLVDMASVRIQPGDGLLRFRLEGRDFIHWSWRGLDTTLPVLRVSVATTFDRGRGEAGPMCGTDDATPTFYLGALSTTGDWRIARVVGARATPIATGPLAADLPQDRPIRIDLECAVTGEGRDRLVLTIDGVTVADVMDADSLGPFGSVGLLAAVLRGEIRVKFDDLIALGGDTYAPAVALAPGPDASADPSPGSSPEASDDPTGLTTLGATDLVREEPFDDETVWGTRTSDQGSIAYDSGTLRIILRPRDNALWSWPPFETAAAVLSVETDVTLDAGQGTAGPMCGSGGDATTFHYAAVGRSGRLTLGSIADGNLAEIGSFAVPGADDAARAGPFRVRIECAVVGDGTDRVAAWVDGSLVADVTTTSSIGPFGKAAVLGTNAARRWGATFDDLVVRSGAVLAPVDGSPTASPAPTVEPLPSVVAPTPLPVGSLLGAVPAAFAGDCRNVPPDDASGQLEAVLCVPAGDAGTAEYYRYESLASLDAAFERFLDLAGGDRNATDCTAAPALTDYTIDGRTAGRLACYDAPRAGVTVQWTSEDLLVLAFGTHASGSFADAFAWWQDAGPVP